MIFYPSLILWEPPLFPYSILANVKQGEIGDSLGVEGILFPPVEDDDPEVTLIGVGSPVMTMKEMMLPPQTVKMIIGAHIYLEDLWILKTLRDLTDLGHC